jgi:PAS domain S-box-containing protein
VLNARQNEVVGRTLYDYFGTTDPWFAPIAAHRRAIEGHPSTYEQDFGGRTFHSHVEPLRGPDGRVTGAIGVAADITERKRAERVLRESRDALEQRVRARTAELSEANESLRREVAQRRAAEEALRESEQRYAGILDAQQTLVSRSDAGGRVTYVNEAHARAFGTRVGDSAFARVHPDDLAATRAAMDALKNPPYTATLEQRCEVRGEWRTFLWQAGIVRDRAGNVGEYQAVAFDITERRRAEEALRASERRAHESAERAGAAAAAARASAEFNRRLVLEVDHRVRNNLAGLLSLVSVMREGADDVRAFAAAIEGRLLAMTHVHQLLAGTEWRAVDLGTLVTTLLAAVERLGRHPIAVAVGGPPVPVAPRQALPLSMILLEWFTNSSKYGAHSVPGGRLHVGWDVTPPPPPHPSRDGDGETAARQEGGWADGDIRLTRGPADAGGGRLRIAALADPHDGNGHGHGHGHGHEHGNGNGNGAGAGGRAEEGRGAATAAVAEGSIVRLRWRESGGPPLHGPTVASLGTHLVRGFATRELRGKYEPRYPASGADHVLEFPVEPADEGELAPDTPLIPGVPDAGVARP